MFSRLFALMNDQSADLYFNTLWGCFLFRIGLRFTSNVTAS